MTDACQLLRDYTENGSEAAFRELVARYIDLVYSVAVRRAGDDPHLAQDIVQTVFTDLARKARTLRHESMLGGWLHRHACFVSSTMMRGERRRQERERQAMEINTLLHSGESPWEEIAPVLDEAINELDEADRRAVLLRFFEQRDLRMIGVALGTSEDAAQKRVSRALDKLRTLLAQRGVTLSVATLSAVVGSRVSSPAGLAERVSNAALAAASVGFFALLLKLMTPGRIAITLGVATTAFVLTHLALKQPAGRAGNESGTSHSERAARPAVPASSRASVQEPLSSNANAAGVPPSVAGKLSLTIVAADSGKPVPNVPIDYRGWEGGKFSGKKLAANRDGVCEVAFPADRTTDLQLTTRIDGFADTRLHWRPDRGEKIPSSYTMRLIRPLPVGGRVVDSGGQPVAGAKVGFNHDDDPAQASQPEDHEFSWIEVSTENDGRWSINRVAPEMVHRLRGSARHSEYVDSDYLFVSQDRTAEAQLRQGSHVFKLGQAVIVRGTVVDSDEMPVRDAKVRVGHVGESGRRGATSELDGSFVVRGCRPGKNLLSAEAQGFSATTLEVNLSADSEPVQIKLQRGKVLRLRIVNQSGEPIPNAGVWLDTLERNPLDAKPAPVQAKFNGKTGADGRLVWESAPEADLLFGISASGYMRVDSVKVHPDGEEHVVTLPPAVTIAGTVRDALTGELIPKFRIITGWPTKQFVNGVMTNVAQWSTLDRFWMSFSGGAYRHIFEEPVVGGVADPSYIFKFEAEGYAPFVSRTVRPDEGEARLDVTLRKAESTMITALLPDGSPAARADVGLVWPGARLELVPGGFSRNHVQDLSALLKTDAKGRFSLAPNDAITRVIVAHAEGFGETTPTALSADPNIRLQPWGRLEGTYLSGGKPAGDRSLALEYGGSDLSTISSSSGFRAQSDAHGHFVFSQAPPGRHKLMRVVTLTDNSWTGELMTEVEIRPGETTTLTLGASNCAVMVHLGWPDGMKRQASWRVFGSIHTSLPQSPAEVANDAQALAGWRHTPEFRALAAHARHYRLTEDAAGLWSAEDVPPGNYALTVNVIDMPPAGGQGTNRAHAHATVTVPTNASGQDLDLGEIMLQPVQ